MLFLVIVYYPERINSLKDSTCFLEANSEKIHGLKTCTFRLYLVNHGSAN